MAAAALAPYLLESPLMVFVGGSVTGQRQTQEDTDLVLILKFLASFIADRQESEAAIARSYWNGAMAWSPVGSGVRSLLPVCGAACITPRQADDFSADILRHVFNAPGGGQLHIVRLQGSEGEIGLRVGENDWFGVVNVGDAKKLCDLCAERKTADDHYVVDDLSFSGSLFETSDVTAVRSACWREPRNSLKAGVPGVYRPWD